MSSGRRGFSLLEVVVAMAVAAIAIVPVIAFLSVAAVESGKTRDRLTAMALSDAVRLELSASLPSSNWVAFSGTQLAASRDGDDVHPPGVPNGEEYFLVDVMAAKTGGAGFLDVEVSVSWPFRISREGRVLETDPATREHAGFGLRLRG
ncbi:MAG TPA: prepilin-type N-terminal cleavage/methylation domain-containing protein [Candidatus Didemnitutus sp.]|jgi:prepilin-type N-terminal cleavage/methylation domain-containing protein